MLVPLWRLKIHENELTPKLLIIVVQFVVTCECCSVSFYIIQCNNCAVMCFFVICCSPESMDTYIALLQTYSGRDKILRTASYVGTLLSGSAKNEETAKKLVTISRQISDCRVVLRFFDDILMWRITRHWSVEVYLCFNLKVMTHSPVFWCQLPVPIDWRQQLSSVSYFSGTRFLLAPVAGAGWNMFSSVPPPSFTLLLFLIFFNNLKPITATTTSSSSKSESMLVLFMPVSFAGEVCHGFWYQTTGTSF